MDGFLDVKAIVLLPRPTVRCGPDLRACTARHRRDEDKMPSRHREEPGFPSHHFWGLLRTAVISPCTPGMYLAAWPSMARDFAA